MSSHDFDLFVIGAGSGGVRAARMAAATGARVAVAEAGRLGGTCVNLGCVPKKLFVYASGFADAFADAAGFGWSVPAATFDWPTLRANKDREIARLNGIYRGLLEGAGVTIIEGWAHVDDAHTVSVGACRYSAAKILVATGGRPTRPDIPGAEFGTVSDDMFSLEHLPERAVIVGGGYIAVEFAGILHGLGVEVTQTYRGPLFLRGFDDDLRGCLANGMRQRGIDLRFDTDVTRLEPAGGGVRVHLGDDTSLESDLVLFATGREPNTCDLGLVEAGVELDPRGAVVVDAASRTRVPSIFAVGDCTDRMALTPVAIAEAMAFVDSEYRGRPTSMDYDNIPTAVFSRPQIATVGLSETAARKLHVDDLEVYRSTFRPMQFTLAGREERMMMKLVVARSTRKLLGVHVAGPEAGEIIQGFAVALNMGATKEDLDRTVGIHPTAAEELVTMRDPV